jgi:hypothetical protein
VKFRDLFGGSRRRGKEGGGIAGAPELGLEDVDIDEWGPGAPSIMLPELTALRWAAQHEAVNVGSMPLEPERWEGGRLAFEYEHHMAHDHEGLRDRLADIVSAKATEIASELYEDAREVAVSREELRVADRDLGVVLSSWNRTLVEVHEDDLELGRYYRLRSKVHGLSKTAVAVLFFFAELAITVALFDEVIATDIRALPVLFAMGLVLVLIVVPHYAAEGIKDGVTKYHEAELDAHDSAAARSSPSRLRKRARQEQVEDAGVKYASALVAGLLIVLFIPLSWLRAEELGSEGDLWLWFCFFLMLQAAISGYFFLRAWIDYGTASVNLKNLDAAKAKSEKVRERALETYADDISAFMVTAQQLLGYYRAAPRWDSYIVQTYFATVRYFRHLVTLKKPELDVFIHHAAIPCLQTDDSLAALGSAVSEVASHQHFGSGWWLRQMDAALVDHVSREAPVESGTRDSETPGVSDVHVNDQSQSVRTGDPTMFESPSRLLDEFLSRYFGVTEPYAPPVVLHHLVAVHDAITTEMEGKASDARADDLGRDPANGDMREPFAARVREVRRLAEVTVPPLTNGLPGRATEGS